MRLYLVRHGESLANAQKRWTGWQDVPLTDKGRADAAKARAFLEGISFDRVWSSDLIRARETAAIALPQIPAEPTPLLREINVGDLAGQPLSTPLPPNYVPSRDGYAVFGGESREAFHQRTKDFLRLVEEAKPERAAVFSHAGFLRNVLDDVLGLYLPRKALLCRNCAVLVLEGSEKGWSVHSWINLD